MVTLLCTERSPYHTPRKTKFLGGYIGFTLSVCLSVRLSVCRQDSCHPTFLLQVHRIDFKFGILVLHMEKVCHDLEIFRLTDIKGH